MSKELYDFLLTRYPIKDELNIFLKNSFEIYEYQSKVQKQNYDYTPSFICILKFTENFLNKLLILNFNHYIKNKIELYKYLDEKKYILNPRTNRIETKYCEQNWTFGDISFLICIKNKNTLNINEAFKSFIVERVEISPIIVNPILKELFNKIENCRKLRNKLAHKEPLLINSESEYKNKVDIVLDLLKYIYDNFDKLIKTTNY